MMSETSNSPAALPALITLAGTLVSCPLLLIVSPFR
jgi:hypothetical protein